MPTRQVLERLGTTQLAVLCQKVADEPHVDETTVERAWQLKQEWAMLQTRPEQNLTDQNDKEAKLMAVRQRMIDLLSKKV